MSGAHLKPRRSGAAGRGLRGAPGLPPILWLMLLLVATPTWAADADGRFAIKGVGATSCGDFTSLLANQSPDAQRHLGWLQGFLTAENRHRAETFDLAAWQHPATLVAALQDYCRAHPQAAIYTAAMALIEAMEPGRLREQSLRVEARAAGKSISLYAVTLERLQRALIARGLLAEDGASGQFDAATQEAIEAFQRENDQPVTGLPDQRTLQALVHQGV
ncbi:MAG: peptidoglycan-binding protein [Chromatiaceae bacterium]|nr:peptidoglycan-binding protein [Chromatiaceae bacterium]